MGRLSKYELQSDEWDVSREREFMENLLYQRFNFFMIIYALVLAGVFKTEDTTYQLVLLGLGFVVLVMFAPTIVRNQYKVNIMLEILFEHEEHAATISNSEAGRKENARKLLPVPVRWMGKGSRRNLIGYWIPLVCILSLVALGGYL